MSRDLSAGNQSAIAAKIARPALLVFLDFVGGPVYMWSGRGTLAWDGHDFLGAGSFGGISPVKETRKISANGLELSLSGVPTESIADALTLNRGRTAKLWRVYFDGPGTTIIADPFQTFGGFINKIRIVDSGETSKIVVALESRIVDLNRSRDRRWTDEQQKADHPGDRAFEFVAGIQNQKLPWGQPGGVGATAQAPLITQATPKDTDFL